MHEDIYLVLYIKHLTMDWKTIYTVGIRYAYKVIKKPLVSQFLGAHFLGFIRSHKVLTLPLGGSYYWNFLVIKFI